MKLGSNRKSIGMGAGYREFSFDNKRVDTYQWQWSMFVWHVSSLHFTFRSVLDFVKGMIILEVKEEKSLMTLLSLWANKWTLSWKGWRKPRKSEWESEKDKSRTKKEGLVTRQWRRKLSLRGWPKIRSGGRERETLEVQILWEISFLMIAFLIGKQTILINLSSRRPAWAYTRIVDYYWAANVLNGWLSPSWSVADAMGRCLRLSRYFNVSWVTTSASSVKCRLRKRWHGHYSVIEVMQWSAGLPPVQCPDHWEKHRCRKHFKYCVFKMYHFFFSESIKYIGSRDNPVNLELIYSRKNLATALSPK